MQRRPLILGTAGHIDHGKTALVRALTGIDCDRLPEEKSRGITIDIGFAHLNLGETRLGIIDVPGHERFIRNMLAGASGIDIAMLIVAADDSVMPQTREHLALLGLLGIQTGIVVITKIDLAEPGRVQQIEQDVRDLVRGSFLENAPIVHTSAVLGRGINELRDLLTRFCAGVQTKPPHDLFRLAIDRSFAVAGRGTVVTGTVWTGQLRAGDEIELLPSQRLVRVRGIQTHSDNVEMISAGQRAAINLTGIHHDEITRGHELATTGYLKPSHLLTATISVLPDSPWPVRHRGQVRLHLGTQERIATVSLLNGTEIQPGGLADVQLGVDEPTVAVAGQPLVVRAVSPMHTLGGGHVLQPVASRLNRRDTDSIARLADLKASRPDDRGAAAIYFYGTNSWSSLGLARDARLTRAQADQLVLELAACGTLIGGAIHRDIVHRIEASLLGLMEKLHAQSPAAPAIERARLLAVARRWGEPRVINTLIDGLIRAGRLSGDEHTVAVPRFQPRLTAAQARLREFVLSRYRSGALTPPDVAALQQEAKTSQAELRRVVDLCVAEGALVHLGQGMLLHREAEAELRRRVEEIFATRDRATLSQIRQLLGTTRKYALPFCEYLDRIGLTRRTGDVRELCRRQASHV